MSGDSIKSFQPVFKRPDFDAISDLNSVVLIADQILFMMHIPSAEDRAYAGILDDYLRNLQSFSAWINARNVPDLAQGIANCTSSLSEAIGVFNGPVEKRSLYENRRNKLIKMFLGSISVITRGLRVAFYPDVLSSTNITVEQVLRYIFDKSVGLGRKFLFNKRGVHSFVNKVYSLNVQELLVVLRLLTNPSGSQVRTFNKWRDLGSGGAP